MLALATQPLQTCSSSSPALDEEAIRQNLQGLNGWQLVTSDGIRQLQKVFIFDNYASALNFINTIAELAEQANHHPCMCIEWGKVSVTWWTHSISGLFINDFIMAAQCDEAYSA